MKHYHLIGIGGVSMSAIALILQKKGYLVTGSDRQESETVRRLRQQGINVFVGHDVGNIEGADVVVYTAAIGPDNPELVEARNRAVTTIERPVLLGQIMKDYEHSIAVAGSHGKTTTVRMVAAILEQGGWDPTALFGTDRDNLRLGDNKVIVTEACEAFGSFLRLSPSLAVVLNIDADHLDFYGTVDQIEFSFRQFAGRVASGGCVVACADDERVKNALGAPGAEAVLGDVRVVWFGRSEIAGYRAVEVSSIGMKSTYKLLVNGEVVGTVTVGVPGEQNVMNSLAAVVVGFELGVPFETICRALESYRGAPRRFEVLYNDDVIVIDDYAHHPAEIEATIKTVRSVYGGRVVSVFQPHLYSRTRWLLDEFARALSDSDEVIVTPIYPAREEPIPGVSGETIVRRMRECGYQFARYESDMSRLVVELADSTNPGDVVLIMGAGDIRGVAEALTQHLRGKLS
ncbi:MAG: UDP-N-acetylmuramate--L-alanine ligase [Armatimonadota bacterium]